MPEPKKKKIPERRCVGCGGHKPKPELMRVVRSPEGEVTLDPTGKKSGRGAYVCKSADCLRRAVKNRGLARNLECAIPDDVADALAEAIAEFENAPEGSDGR